LLAVLLAAPFLAQAVATIANVATPAIRTDQLAFTGRERVRAIGLFAIALSTGAVLGQIMGGELVSAHLAGTGWRPIFLVNVPICLGVAVAALRVLHTDEPTAGARLDVPGVLGLTATVLLVVVPLTHGRAEWWPLWTWLCLAATVPAFWLFWPVSGGGRPPVPRRWSTSTWYAARRSCLACSPC
jgi:MFS family permease